MPQEFADSDNRPYGTSQFRLSDGSFQLVTRYLTVSGYTSYRVKTGFYCSTGNKTRNSSGMYVPAGSTVKITRIFMPSDGSGVWYELSRNDRTGWLYSQNY